MAYTITVLAWGGVAYPDGYANAGQTSYLLQAVKWGTDYFIKAHVSPFVFYGQVKILYIQITQVLIVILLYTTTNFKFWENKVGFFLS